MLAQVVKNLILVFVAVIHNYTFKPPSGSSQTFSTNVYKGQLFEQIVHVQALSARVCLLLLGDFVRLKSDQRELLGFIRCTVWRSRCSLCSSLLPGGSTFEASPRYSVS